MTKEQYDFLKQYEQNLWTAQQLDYSRNLPQSVLIEMDKIHFELFKENSGLLANCSRCSLKGLKRLAKVYFEYKDKLKANMEKARACRDTEGSKQNSKQQQKPKDKQNVEIVNKTSKQTNKEDKPVEQNDTEGQS